MNRIFKLFSSSALALLLLLSFAISMAIAPLLKMILELLLLGKLFIMHGGSK